MFSDFFKELLNIETIEKYYGFVTYEFWPNDTIYLRNMYIKPQFRGFKKSNELESCVIEIGKIYKCKYIVSSVNSLANESERSHKLHKNNGYKIFKIDRDFIYYCKEL